MRLDWLDSAQYIAHYGVGHLNGGHSGRYPWGSGQRPMQSEQYAGSIVSSARKKEPQITKDVVAQARKCGGTMYGLEHRLKTRESTSRKIDTDSVEKGISKYEAASSIKDAVRYTMVSSDKDFVRNYNSFKRGLLSNGYTEARCKNYFDLYRQGKVKHKSVQSVFATPDGYRFEVQFQTPASQNAKNRKLPLYEEARKPYVSAERKRYLERRMELLAEAVPNPRGVYSIETHN